MEIKYENYNIKCSFEMVCPYCSEKENIRRIDGELPLMRCEVCYKIFWRDFKQG